MQERALCPLLLLLTVMTDGYEVEDTRFRVCYSYELSSYKVIKDIFEDCEIFLSNLGEKCDTLGMLRATSGSGRHKQNYLGRSKRTKPSYTNTKVLC